MLENLPQWMQDLWPWMLWVGAAGAVASIFWDMLRRWKRSRKGKSIIDD